MKFQRGNTFGPRFPRGVSGNPNGRSKSEAAVIRLAQEHGPEAIHKLAEWMRSDDAMASIRAANALLDRAYGKPKESVDVTVEKTRTIATADMSRADRAALRALALKALERQQQHTIETSYEEVGADEGEG
jgi:hypothetical protein